jgi:hypothetical protein
MQYYSLPLKQAQKKMSRQTLDEADKTLEEESSLVTDETFTDLENFKVNAYHFGEDSSAYQSKDYRGGNAPAPRAKNEGLLTRKATIMESPAQN